MNMNRTNRNTPTYDELEKTEMNIQKLIATFIFLAVLPVQVFAAADIKLAISAEKEIIVKEGSRNVKKRVAAKTIEPGEIIIYTIRYSNRGNEDATNVDVKNPVPGNTEFVSGSAKGKGADITFSADGGKSFGKGSSVTYQVKKSTGKTITRKAGPENYTNVRWVIARVKPGKSGKLEYRVRVK
jgi:uncharacterized repeat protein (TIGR01451 family)